MKNRSSIINKKKNYQRLFQMRGHYYLLGDIFRHNYEKLDFLALSEKNKWKSYLPKSSFNKALNEGLELFSKKYNFNKYAKDYNHYKKSSLKFFKSIKTKISRKELMQYLKFLSESFVYYSRTEFIYSDKAFFESKRNKTIRMNLKKMELIKNSGREHLNKLFIEKNNFLKKLLKILSKQFKVKVEELECYSRKELIELFDNKKVNNQHIKNRKRAYVLLADKQKTTAYEGDEAKSMIDEFREETIKKDIIKGTTANKGKARGRVKIIAYDSDSHKLEKLCKEMKQGEILVAETTSPDLIIACHKASAIVTNQGGQLSHAAIISREMNIPCVIATGNATEVLKDGDYVEVDANKGVVRKIKSR